MGIYKKLQEARIKLQNTKLQKTGRNTFAKYDYFELADFLPATQNIFLELGLCGVVSYAQDLATLTIVDTEDNSQITITSPMVGADMKGLLEIQKLGAVETYQRRYLWVAAMEIVEHDAIDASTEPEPPQKKATPQKKEEPKGLPDSDIDDVILAMRETDDMTALKAIFGPAFLKASKPQQAELKKAYDKQKEKIAPKESA